MTLSSILQRALFTALMTTGALIVVPGCSGADSAPIAEDNTEQAEDALSGDKAVARAMEWVDAELHYCQSPNHEHDYDSACSKVCERKDNKEWNPYRSDCSGLVSWAWGLAAPGRVTTEFAPFNDGMTKKIEATDLKPGDAVNNADHVMLFEKWIVKNHRALFIEEPGCSASPPHARETDSVVHISGDEIHVVENGMTFTAIRRK